MGMAFLIKMFGVSLAATLGIELTMAFALGLRSVKYLVLVVLANVLTNPPAVLFYWLGTQYLPGVPQISLQIVIEAVVMAVEAVIYISFAKQPWWDIRHPAAFAIAANLASWLLGRFL